MNNNEDSPEKAPDATTFLRFACQFSNNAVGSICIDLRRFQKKGLLQFEPHIMGPAPEDEVEVWMREEVLQEIVEQTGKCRSVTGASGVEWLLRPGQPAEHTGRNFPHGFSSILPELEEDFRRKLTEIREENARLRAKLDEKRKADE